MPPPARGRGGGRGGRGGRGGVASSGGGGDKLKRRLFGRTKHVEIGSSTKLTAEGQVHQVGVTAVQVDVASASNAEPEPIVFPGSAPLAAAAPSPAPTPPPSPPEGVPADGAPAASAPSPALATPTLHGLDVQIEAGKLTMIAGSVGCGKSSFLSALLGEVPTGAGGEVGGMPGRVGYFAQTAFILNETIRENVS